MNLLFRSAKMSDLESIMIIENAGFSPEDAASKIAMKQRIEVISDSFIIAETNEKEIAGYVVGPVIDERFLYDELFDNIQSNPKSGGFQSVLSLAVGSKFQKQGVASQLLLELDRICLQQQREGITLTCLDNLIPFYESNGYKNEGLSNSSHGGKQWYNMIKEL